MKEVMLHEKNPLNNHWLCWIPETPYAYSFPRKNEAKKLCDKFNKSFHEGSIKFDDKGRIVKVEK